MDRLLAFGQGSREETHGKISRNNKEYSVELLRQRNYGFSSWKKHSPGRHSSLINRNGTILYFSLKNLILRARSETIGYAGIFQ